MSAYQPILTEASKKTKTYRIASLFYVALFGGALALTVMGSINSRMLQMKGSYNLALSALFCIVARFTVCALDAHHIVELSGKLAFSLFKMADLLLFVIFYQILKVPYRLHMIYHAEYERMCYRGLAPLVCIVYMIADCMYVMFIYSGKG